MRYKLKKIFYENSKNNLHEAKVSFVINTLKDILSSVNDKNKAKKAEKVLKLLRFLKKVGIKKLGNTDINKIIISLENISNNKAGLEKTLKNISSYIPANESSSSKYKLKNII